jgi:hypothetical protein
MWGRRPRRCPRRLNGMSVLSNSPPDVDAVDAITPARATRPCVRKSSRANEATRSSVNKTERVGDFCSFLSLSLLLLRLPTLFHSFTPSLVSVSSPPRSFPVYRSKLLTRVSGCGAAGGTRGETSGEGRTRRNEARCEPTSSSRLLMSSLRNLPLTSHPSTSNSERNRSLANRSGTYLLAGR